MVSIVLVGIASGELKANLGSKPEIEFLNKIFSQGFRALT
jgi:hypothetical protein